jgi:hypothetical protein
MYKKSYLQHLIKKAYRFTEVLDFTEENIEGENVLQFIKERN